MYKFWITHHQNKLSDSSKVVVTSMDTSKSGWTPYDYYTTLFSTPHYTILGCIYWARELLEKRGKSE